MFGKRLASLRKQKGLTQYELADALGFSRGQIANYEQGSREPDFETLQKIARFFQVSTDYLLGLTDAPTPYYLEQHHEVHVAGEIISLTTEEFSVFEEMKKHPILFHDLADDPEKKVKQLINVWDFIKKQIEEKEDSTTKPEK